VTAFALLFTLSAIGIAETAYLIRERRAGEQPVCPIGGGCHEVLESQYNRTFWIHNDILGFLFYVSMATLTGLTVAGIGPVFFWMVIAVAQVTGAFVMSAYFFFLQWRVIKAWCFWCLMSAATVAGMVLVFALDRLTSLQTL